MDIISGERIQQLCTVYCGTEKGEYDLQKNPLIRDQPDKHFYIDTLECEWDNPSVIFCYSNVLHIFMQKLKYLKNPFTLVSHNEDTNITDEFKDILEYPLLIHWFAQNTMIIHTKLTMLPIGIANSMWAHGNVDTLLSIPLTYKSNDIYFYFSIDTNTRKRQSCKDIIERKGFNFGSNVEYKEYLHNLASCKFAICPEGNGIDCHRTWESYYLGVIPILLESVFTKELQKKMPCILLKSWEDFNIKECLVNYDSLKLSLENSKQYISLSYYKNIIQQSVSMNLVYVFIGSLPEYAVDTVKQTRLFYTGPIYFIISDYSSQFLHVLESVYNVTIISYNSVIDYKFNTLIKSQYNKFVVVLENLKGREKMFIYSIERFIVLHNLMKYKNLTNIFFMELDNPMYDNPLKWLANFVESDIAYMYDNNSRFAPGVCYIKDVSICKLLCDYIIYYIENSTKILSEMDCLSNFYDLYKKKINMLPIHWPISLYPREYNNIFDSASMKIFIIHYKKLVQRKENMIRQFVRNNITNYEFIEIDRDELKDDDLQIFQENYNKAQIAITLSHMYAYKEISEKYENALILEDDAIFSDNCIDTLHMYMKELPNDYDMLFIGNGCNLHIEPHIIQLSKYTYLKGLYPTSWGGDGISRCTDSYVVSKKCATKLCNYINTLKNKINIPIDWWINVAARDTLLKGYWAEPTIVSQGTQNGMYSSSH